MSTLSIAKESTRTNPVMLELGRLDARVRIRPLELREGLAPVGGRVIVSPVDGWSAQSLHVRRVVGSVPEAFGKGLSLAAGSGGTLELPAEEIQGDVEIEVGADAVEANAIVGVVFEFDYPARDAAVALSRRFVG